MSKRFLLIYFWVTISLAGAVLAAGGAFVYKNFHAEEIVAIVKEQVDKRVPQASGLVQFLAYDSGLFIDPAIFADQEMHIPLPPWRGLGASALRAHAPPSYTFEGKPISLAQGDLAAVARPPKLKTRTVASVAEFEAAVNVARPGDEIVLAAGNYRFEAGHVLSLAANGSSEAPIIVRGESIKTVRLTFAAGARLVVSGAYWGLSDLIVRGRCGQAACPGVLDVRRSADAFVARNVFVSGVRVLATGGGDEGEETTRPLMDGVTVVAGRAAERPARWRLAMIKEIDVSPDPAKFTILCPRNARDADCDGVDFAAAVNRHARGHTILLRSGTYRQAALITAERVVIVAEPGAHFTETATAGKGAIVTTEKTNLTLDGLECSLVKVSSGNGACLRQQGGMVVLRGVNFHHNQMGILMGNKGDRLRIEDSFIHDSGRPHYGLLGHNIYANGSELFFVRSWSLRAGRSGHQLKSRAELTFIEDSVLASGNSVDSRVLDIPQAGRFVLKNSIIGEGPRSENWDIIGYGLETNVKQHESEDVLIEGNTFYVDKKSAHAIGLRKGITPRVSNNVFVGRISDSIDGDNIFCSSRKEAEVPPYPSLVYLDYSASAHLCR